MSYSKNIILFIALYISLIIGFLLNENLNYGSYQDWVNTTLVIESFSRNLTETLLNYEAYGHRHSPVYLIFLSFFHKLGLSFDLIRLIHLHLCLSLVLIFYKCLKLKFNQTDKKILKILALIVFLSPTFRSISIWPDTRLPGLIFFTISVYYFLKFLKNSDYKYVWLCSIWLIISSYVSPNFSIFSFYYYFIFFKKLNFIKFYKLIFFNLVSCIPILYYLFFLDVNFLTAGKTPGLDGDIVSLNFNYSNKILIISTIILFHLLPVVFYTIDYKKFFFFFKTKLPITAITLLPVFYFFDYNIKYTGGGVFFQLSQFLFDNNFLFFLVSLFSISLLLFFSKASINNFFIVFLLILSNIQMTIYHKYYEPFVLIIFFLLFKKINFQNFFNNKHSILYLYLYSILFVVLRIAKNYFIV